MNSEPRTELKNPNLHLFTRHPLHALDMTCECSLRRCKTLRPSCRPFTRVRCHTARGARSRGHQVLAAGHCCWISPCSANKLRLNQPEILCRAYTLPSRGCCGWEAAGRTSGCAAAGEPHASRPSCAATLAKLCELSCCICQVLQARGETAVSPGERNNLHPLLVPLSRAAPGSDGAPLTCMLRRVSLSGSGGAERVRAGAVVTERCWHCQW